MMMNGMKQRKPILATLADLLAPVSTSEFLEVFRAKKRFHIAASDPSRAETLLPWPDIDTLLSAHALDENVRIIRDGVPVPRQFYTSNEGKQLNVRAFHDLLPQGVSIVVECVECLIPQISQLCAAIERVMGTFTYANAYLSFFKGGAFKRHWDFMDVLIVQVHGNKRWRVWNAEVLYPYPGEMGDRAKVDTAKAPDQEVEMKPGDVLFIPRGEPHSAAVSTKHSVHLTIGLISETGIKFLGHLRKTASKDPILRMDLPGHSSGERSVAHEAAVKHRLHQLIDAASMSQFLLEDDLSRLPALQTAVARELPQMEDILRLTLRRRVPLPDVAPSAGAQFVTIGGEARRLSPASIDLLRWLFDHDPSTLLALHAGLLPRHGQDSIEAAIRELLRFGFLVVNQATH
jgi:ribosomal protein L16 Arg81 hydroxylase